MAEYPRDAYVSPHGVPVETDRHSAFLSPRLVDCSRIEYRSSGIVSVKFESRPASSLCQPSQ